MKANLSSKSFYSIWQHWTKNQLPNNIIVGMTCYGILPNVVVKKRLQGGWVNKITFLFIQVQTAIIRKQFDQFTSKLMCEEFPLGTWVIPTNGSRVIAVWSWIRKKVSVFYLLCSSLSSKPLEKRFYPTLSQFAKILPYSVTIWEKNILLCHIF